MMTKSGFISPGTGIMLRYNIVIKVCMQANVPKLTFENAFSGIIFSKL